jgi:hypothetical protein
MAVSERKNARDDNCYKRAMLLAKVGGIDIDNDMLGDILRLNGPDEPHFAAGVFALYIELVDKYMVMLRLHVYDESSMNVVLKLLAKIRETSVSVGGLGVADAVDALKDAFAKRDWGLFRTAMDSLELTYSVFTSLLRRMSRYIGVESTRA